MAPADSAIAEFPYSLYVPISKQRQADINLENLSTISLPLPTNRLASSAMRTLEVDAELSPFVRRTFALETPISEAPSEPLEKKQKQDPEESKTVLKTTYSATTNRMLRVSVNGFMESLGVVLGVMAELDVDVLQAEMEG
jgi:EKC/KEOPS complex subunit PCC1/LAGE3